MGSAAAYRPEDVGTRAEMAVVAEPAADFVRCSAGLDRILGLFALSRVRLSLIALEIDGASERVARQAALAACGRTGLLEQLAPGRFLVIDVGPRDGGYRGEAAIAARIVARAAASLRASARADDSTIRCVENHAWSDEIVSSAFRLGQLMSQLDHAPAVPSRMAGIELSCEAPGTTN